MDKKAYSVLTIKSVNEEKRTIEGIATTPTPDRVGDVVETDGIEFKLPLPFLYQHDYRKPIGSVVEAKMTAKGMTIKTQIAPAGIADFIDEAWALIKNGLIRGLSIGFRSLEESFDKSINGFRYIKTELMEISAVTIPANAEANITAVKHYDAGAPAALGQTKAAQITMVDHKPTSGVPVQTKTMKGFQMIKTIGEQIAGFEAKRAANVARQETIRAGAAEAARAMDDVEGQEFDGLSGENETIDTEIQRLKRHAKQMDAAKPIENVNSIDAGVKARSGVVVVGKSNLIPGIAFTRFAMALMRSKGNLPQAEQIARGWRDTPEVEAVLKVAVAAGTTTADGWATELADYTYMASEFIEFLRPQTIIGKIPGLRRVPFNIKLPVQDAGASVGWVGEGAQKPVSKLHFDTVNFRFAKAAGIVVFTDELVRFSNPAAEMLVRDDLAKAIAQFLDAQFIDPTVAVNGTVSPASIANGAGHSAASGTTAADARADLENAITQMVNAEIDVTGMVICMRPTLAVSLSLMRNLMGGKEFPDIKASGGEFEGYQVITSNSVPAGVVVYLVPSQILIADEGGINLDSSTEASLVMDDGVSPAGTTLVSLWQKNLVALRAERIINWDRRRDPAVYYVTGAGYGTASPA